MISDVGRITTGASLDAGDRYVIAKISLVMLLSGIVTPAIVFEFIRQQAVVNLCQGNIKCGWISDRLIDASFLQAGILLFALLILGIRKDGFYLAKSPRDVTIYIVSFAAVNAILILLASVLIFFVVQIEPAHSFLDLLESRETRLYTLIYIVLSVAIGPLIEEFVFRGVFWNAIERNYSGGRAFFIVSIMFCLFHIGDGLWKVIFIIPYAIMFGFIRERSQSFMACGVIHVITNIEGTLLPNIVYFAQK